MAEGILEAIMMMCFASAWPMSIIRLYRARTTIGTSIQFMIILELGYVAGILNKVTSNDMNYVLLFYVFNLTLVAICIVVYARNYRLDKIRDIKTNT